MNSFIFRFVLVIDCFAFCLLLSQCHRTNRPGISRRNQVEIIKVPEDYNNVLPSDSLISNIRFITLETDKNCLISNISGLSFFKDRFYILDRNVQQILIFDATGHFINKIYSIGRGPGEYSQIRDYKIDHSGNIYILSFNKILKYSDSGIFLKQTDFNFLADDATAFNPVQFALAGDGGFYLWKGSFGFKENSNQEFYALYRTNKKMKIINKYFRLERSTFEGLNMFYGVEGNYYLQTLMGNDTLYNINEGGVSEKYIIDFGRKKLPYTILKSEGNISRLYSEILTSSKYSMNADNIFETNRYLYFLFANGTRWRNVFFSKYSKRTLVGTVDLLVSSPVQCTFNDAFVSVLYKGKSSGVLFTGKETETERKIEEFMNSVKELNNPVLFVYNLIDF